MAQSSAGRESHIAFSTIANLRSLPLLRRPEKTVFRRRVNPVSNANETPTPPPIADAVLAAGHRAPQRLESIPESEVPDSSELPNPNEQRDFQHLCTKANAQALPYIMEHHIYKMSKSSTWGPGDWQKSRHKAELRDLRGGHLRPSHMEPQLGSSSIAFAAEFGLHKHALEHPVHTRMGASALIPSGGTTETSPDRQVGEEMRRGNSKLSSTQGLQWCSTTCKSFASTAASTGMSTRMGSTGMSSRMTATGKQRQSQDCGDLDIPEDELRKRLRSMLISAAGGHHEVLLAMDLNRSGRISFQEFATALEGFRIPWRSMTTKLRKPRDIFKLFDVDNSGFITHPQLFPSLTSGALVDPRDISTPDFWSNYCRGTKDTSQTRNPIWQTGEGDLPGLLEVERLRSEDIDTRKWMGTTMRDFKHHGTSGARCREILAKHLPKGTGPRDREGVATFSSLELKSCKKRYNEQESGAVRNIQKAVYQMKAHKKVLQDSRKSLNTLIPCVAQASPTPPPPVAQAPQAAKVENSEMLRASFLARTASVRLKPADAAMECYSAEMAMRQTR